MTPNVRVQGPAEAEGRRPERTGKRSLPAVPWNEGLERFLDNEIMLLYSGHPRIRGRTRF